MIQSVNLPPSAYTISSSAHCSTLQPSAAYSQTSSAHTTAAITSSVHTAAMYSHVQLSAANLQCTLQPCTAMYSYLQPIFSAHCSHVQLSAANLQCTLQPTAAIYNHLHYSYTIQCTLQLHYLMPIPYSASSEEG